MYFKTLSRKFSSTKIIPNSIFKGLNEHDIYVNQTAFAKGSVFPKILSLVLAMDIGVYSFFVTEKKIEHIALLGMYTLVFIHPLRYSRQVNLLASENFIRKK